MAKLLKQQEEEQSQAYKDRRLRKCKQMLFENRKAKALQTQTAREAKQRQMDEQSRLEQKAVEQQRKVDVQGKRDEYAAINKTRKAQKRRVNIEIASGIVDLIMDLSDEVFDVTQAQAGKKLSKAQWREFSSIFVEGKKVSLRNIKKQLVDADQVDKQESDGSLHIPQNLSAVQLTSKFRKEPSLHDLYMFVCNAGLFNLTQIRRDVYDSWSARLGIQHVVADGSLQRNTALGTILESLYQSESMGSSAMRIQDEAVDDLVDATQEDLDSSTREVPVPTDLPLKLSILGRAFAGKKTIAKQLQEKYGATKLKLFSMDEIIAEALEYIAPKKVEESQIIDPKKAKKGKVEEVVPVDIFEGKNTVPYKQVANEMKSKFFSDYEGELPSKVDLANHVFDDELLVALFLERLKLEYQGVEIDVSKEDLEAGVIREREIVQQLAELEDTIASSDPKKGGKGAAKGGKPPEETLRDELEQIRSLEMKGWILLDFPRNLTQFKYLETALSGYQSKADQPKSSSQEKYETWIKVASPATLVRGDGLDTQAAVQSGFDGVLILETPQDECERRSSGRKIDPQTSTVYHMATNAPEDSKVLERLQDFEDEAGNADRMQKISASFGQSISAIKQWLTRFGLTPEGSETCAVQLDMAISADEETWQDKDQVMGLVTAKVDQIVAYKQAQFQARRDAIREALELREKEEAERAAQEASQEEAAQSAQE